MTQSRRQRLTPTLAAQLEQRIAVLASRVERVERELADERERNAIYVTLVRGRIAGELQALKDAGAINHERQVAA